MPGSTLTSRPALRLLPRENSRLSAPARGCPEDHRAWLGDGGAPGVLLATPLSRAPRERRPSSRTALLRARPRPPRLPLRVCTPPALPAHCCWPHSEPRPPAWKHHLCPAHGSPYSNISRLPRLHAFLRSPESRPTAHTHSPYPPTHALPTSRAPRRGSMPPPAALTAALPVCLLTVCLALDKARG